MAAVRGKLPARPSRIAGHRGARHERAGSARGGRPAHCGRTGNNSGVGIKCAPSLPSFPPLLSSSLSLYAKDDVKDGTENAKDDVVTRDTTSNLKHVQPLTQDTDASASGGERGEAGGTD